MHKFRLIEVGVAKVYHGSCLDVLPTLPDSSVDSIVTDPPYELGFMGKKWDSTGIAFNPDVWLECLRVLKPGGHLLAFGGSRTWHRLAVAIEDAGFEVRDSIAWLYGSGFPKSLDVSKAIDKAAGAEREVLGKEIAGIAPGQGNAVGGPKPLVDVRPVAVTPEAQKWQGWGTALKPAFEPIVVARKPVEGTVAANVLEWGVGGLNIDGSRIPSGDTIPQMSGKSVLCGTSGGWDSPWKHDPEAVKARENRAKNAIDKANTMGRWPANVMLDEYTAALVDEQSGVGVSKAGNRGLQYSGSHGGLAGSEKEYKEGTDGIRGYNDSGGASRFFYVAKANKRDRNEGLDKLEARRASAMGYDRGLGDAGEGMFKDRNPQKQNFHPTVKPTDLMRQLVRLVTPPGGTVLDPFTGSGTTGKAAILEGFSFIGIELTEDYLPIIEGRLKHATQVKETEESQPTQGTIF